MTGALGALGVLLMVTANGVGPETAGRGSAPWRAYKTAWEQARTARDVAALDRLERSLPLLEAELSQVVAAPLATDLVAVVRTRAADWRAAIAPSLGEPEARDRREELRASMADLALEHRALEQLRALSWKDPWIEAKFAAYVAFVSTVVSGQAEQLELESGERDPLAREARALVTRLAPALRARRR